MKRFLILALILFTNLNLYCQNFKVLFIGNSYTYVNNLPQAIADIANAMGDTFSFDSNTPGGYTLNLHTSNATTLSKINAQPWDFVVLQEQSQLPSFDPIQVSVDVYPYARELDSLILVNDSCTETFFYMTWGRQNGDMSNCGTYPPVCTYNGMQQRLRDSYLQMSIGNNASVSPVGVAWKLFRDAFPGINLYQPDESHPSIYGTYLAACVFYTSFYHKSSVGCSFITPGISALEGLAIQTIASSTVLDSISTWQGNGDVPIPSYTYSALGNMIQFNNSSSNSASYSWDFGDGNSSNFENPQNTYSVDGQYFVTLTASTNCLSYSFTDTIFVNASGVLNLSNTFSVNVFPNPVTNQICIYFENNLPQDVELSVYNSLGSLVLKEYYNSQSYIKMNVEELSSGLYTLILNNGSPQIVSRKIIINKL